ncbi:O-antigen ligase family protein [Homoserinimonas sp. A520]
MSASTPSRTGTTPTLPILVSTWFLLVLSVVSWRPDTLYAGGADPVVITKALVTLTAFLCALAIYHRYRMHARVGIRSFSFLIAIVAVSCLGALAAGDPVPSLVLAVRIILVAATVYTLTCTTTPLDLLRSLLIAMGILGLIGAVTGIPEFLSEGRLAGGIPAMRPNELAGLAAPPLVGLAIEVTRSGLRTHTAVLMLTFSVIVLATGSRTTLFVAVLAIILAIMLSWPLPHSAGIVLILLAPVIYTIVAFTDFVAQVAVRGQNLQELATLSSRTIAWQAVLDIPMDTWHKWIGAGLAVKTVEVDQRWWETQVLDSSWVSVLSQTGIIGLVLVFVWVFLTLVESARSPQLRNLTFPLLVLLLVRSVAENGLVESSVIFVLFFCISLLIEPGHRSPVQRQKLVRYPLVQAAPGA